MPNAIGTFQGSWSVFEKQTHKESTKDKDWEECSSNKTNWCYFWAESKDTSWASSGCFWTVGGYFQDANSLFFPWNYQQALNTGLSYI